MTDFEASCRSAAASFLQTVVLLDDRADYLPADPLPSEDIVEPGELETTAADAGAAKPLGDGGARLDAGAISRGFAAKGLVCAILKPEGHDFLANEALKAADRADIVVLDWEMGDKGGHAVDMIKRLLDTDLENGGRLRLIVIYTGHSPLTNVQGKIDSDVAALSPLSKRSGRLDLSLETSARTTRVVILAKSAPVNAPKEAHLAVGADDLPDRLIGEFAKFAGGLLSNATLASIAALRRHTHKMLARFDKTLDGPLLTHRALVEPADDTEHFVAGLIIEELETQVPLVQISRQYVGAASVAAFLRDRMDAGLKPKLQIDKGGTARYAELNHDEACRLIEEGSEGLSSKMADYASEAGVSFDGYLELIKKSLHKRLYQMIDETAAVGRTNHERFSIASSMRREASSIVATDKLSYPVLKLGSLLTIQEQFWVCITPICDSVRIPDKGAPFLLAQLNKSPSDFNLVVTDGNANIRLKSDRKKLNLKTVHFAPGKAGIVAALVRGSDAFFGGRSPDELKGDMQEYRWIGELKPMQAQRIVQAFASNIARIGLDEFEWQRLHAPPT